jgi:predicted dehydrogenase
MTERRTSRRTRVAIIGAGIGGKHVDGYLANPDAFEVAVVCDIDTARARPLAERSGAAVSASFEEVLARGDIDIIDICLPPYMHFEAISRALDAGRHVICEKPFVASLDQVEQVRRAAQRAGRQVMPIYQYRYGNGIARLQHLLRHDVAGRPFVAAAETHWHRAPAYYEVPWRGRKATELGGALIGHAIHTHDLLTTVLGPVRRVFAMAAVMVNPVETDDCAAICMEMQSGALVTSSITLGGAPEEITRLRFCFENLTAENDGMPPYQPAEGTWRYLPRGAPGQAAIDQALQDFTPRKESFAGLFEALDDALQAGTSWPITLDDAARSLELVSAIYQSNATGRPVDLPLPQDDPARAGWAALLP